ncbi:TetR/AcrR family transcriptional regulator [Pollutibacter soli]|uniref:TetR/AcrR family transcriptional regulator n=1 Tax=Pollutibacter soli TaxID=3034157 RepID=UPI0030133865
MEITETRIVEAASVLFWKFGLRKVSVEDICKKADISRMTFYRYYTNKTELAKHVFDTSVNAANEKFRIILSASSTAEEFLKNMIDLKSEGTRGISEEFIQDFYGNPGPELRAYVNQRTQEEWKLIKSEFKKAKNRKLIRDDVNIDFLIQLILSYGSLVSNEAFTKIFRKPGDLIKEFTKMIAYGISPAR